MRSHHHRHAPGREVAGDNQIQVMMMAAHILEPWVQNKQIERFASMSEDIICRFRVFLLEEFKSAMYIFRIVILLYRLYVLRISSLMLFRLYP